MFHSTKIVNRFSLAGTLLLVGAALLLPSPVAAQPASSPWIPPGTRGFKATMIQQHLRQRFRQQRTVSPPAAYLPPAATSAGATVNLIVTQPPAGTERVASAALEAQYQSNYPPAESANGAALVRVLVPADAELWFNGAKTTQRGTAREFESPVLTQGKKFAYEVRARWTEEGQVVEDVRVVHVRSNESIVVNFTQPSLAQAGE